MVKAIHADAYLDGGELLVTGPGESAMIRVAVIQGGQAETVTTAAENGKWEAKLPGAMYVAGTDAVALAMSLDLNTSYANWPLFVTATCTTAITIHDGPAPAPGSE